MWFPAITRRSWPFELAAANAGNGAIYELSRILAAFRSELPEPNLTFNVGLIAGGTTATLDADKIRATATGKTNIIPEIAIARGDIRTYKAAIFTAQSWMLLSKIQCDDSLFPIDHWTAIERTHYMESSKLFVPVDRPFWLDKDEETGRDVMSMTLTDRMTRGTRAGTTGQRPLATRVRRGIRVHPKSAAADELRSRGINGRTSSGRSRSFTWIALRSLIPVAPRVRVRRGVRRF